ncbi:MAG: biotin attachment protein [Rhizobiaceae bacterium]|nr:biotin attachment protein [Rhizobiaceae bacterium]
MRVEVLLPQWGMGMSAGTIVEWKKKVGDSIEEGDIIADIEAEKATQELEAPASGVITEILVQENEEVQVRTVLAIIETEG